MTEMGRSFWVSISGFLLLCSLGNLPVLAKEPKKAVPVIGKQADVACDCTYPWREYSRQPTPEVLSLFDAARRLDEAAFARLITTIPDIRDYAVAGQNLLEVLLWPGKDLPVDPEKRRTWTDFAPDQAAAIRSAHAATLPVRERMLALALEHGASPREFTQGHRPALHLSMVFGSPTMIRLLLQHGADPAQRDSVESMTASEFALDNEYFIRMTYLPLLVEPAARTEMLKTLLDAGAGLPFKWVDEFQEKEAGKPPERPAADHLLWPPLLSLTEGEQILTAYAATGTQPVFSEEDMALTPLAQAALAGNPDGVRWLMARAPRQIRTEQTYPLAAGTYDTWLYAAAWAVYPLSSRLGRPDRVDDILKILIQPDMPWLQENTLLDDGHNDLLVSRNQETSTTGTTLLHHLVHTNRPDWVARIVKMGAPVDGGENPPLLTAVRQRNLPMIRLLLSLGANPLTGKEPASSPLYRSVMDRAEDNDNVVQLGETGATEARQVIEALLGALTPDQKTILAREENSLMDVALHQGRAPEGEIVRALLSAGIPWQGLDRSAILVAMDSPDRGLVGALLDYGVRLDETGTGSTLPEIPALVAAIENQRPDLLPRLLQAGADPNLNGRHGNAVQWAILRGDVAALDLLLAHGGQLEKVADSASLLELAVASGNEAMLERLDSNGQADLSAVCIPNGARLQKILFESTDARWHDMLARGLGKRSNRACTGLPPMTVQVLDALLAERDARLTGWRQEQVRRRLGELADRIGKLPEEQGQRLMTQARAAHRDDLVALLENLGVPRLPEIAPKQPAPPPRSTAADKALGKKLVGHYYLENQREVGSEIILRANGRFDYMLAYGADDEAASGTWSVSGGKVMFRQENAVNPEGWQPYRLVSATEKSAAGAADEVVVDVRLENRPVSMLKVVVMGCVAPQTTNGMTFDGRWSGRLAGELCQITLRHPSLNNGEPFIYTLPDALRQAGQRRFVFEALPSALKASVNFDVSMQVERGALIWQRSGREFRYRR